MPKIGNPRSVNYLKFDWACNCLRCSLFCIGTNYENVNIMGENLNDKNNSVLRFAFVLNVFFSLQYILFRVKRSHLLTTNINSKTSIVPKNTKKVLKTTLFQNTYTLFNSNLR